MWAHRKYACQSCWPRNSKSYREATRKLSTALETEKHRGVQVFSWWFLSLYPNFITHHLPFKYFFFLLWSGYNLYCRMQHTTEAPLQVQSCGVKHKAFQPQGTHKPFYLTHLQIPYLFSVESCVLKFHVLSRPVGNSTFSRSMKLLFLLDTIPGEVSHHFVPTDFFITTVMLSLVAFPP